MVDGPEFIEEYDLVSSGGAFDSFDCIFKISPNNFISFAEEDLNEGSKRGFVNALSNIKRSIDCQTELLIYILGNFEKMKKEHWNFPKKISFLERAGVVSSRILKKINKYRNQLEHDFNVPKKEEVEDFLDIANLFLDATSQITRKICNDFAFCSKRDVQKPSPSCTLEWNPKEKKYSFSYTIPPEKSIKKNIDPEKEEDFSFIKLYVNIMKTN